MKPYHKNPRKINDKQLNDLRRWLDELGDLSGIVHDMNSDEIIGGNQRTAVLGFSENDITITERLPEPDRQGTIAHGYILWHGARYAYRQVAWTPEQCERANIIANKAGGDWEIDRLLGEFETAVLLDSGFGQDELDDMLAELEKGKVRETADAEPQTSRADELKQEWATETGQLWILPSRTEGQEHRLICGDCTDKAVVERVMAGDRADTIYTDPPYGYDKGIENDADLDTALKITKEALFRFVMNDDCWIVMDTPKKYIFEFAKMVLSCGATMREPVLTMYRNSMLNGCYGTNIFELSFVYSFGKPKVNRNINGADIIKVGGGEKNAHPTQKFVEAYKHFMGMFSDSGDIVYDPFSGSGTAIIAAENLSRQCRAIEISPAYVAVALQRYLDAFQIRPYLAP